jgi:poly-gamma-glutamate synthesis protein (capsule biosynthesis protein)
VGDLDSLRKSILELRQSVDLLILSIHWGPNMQQRLSRRFRSFAHDLIDLGVDILHGHSAHIFQGVEIYKEKLILYDTGDIVDDYAVDPILRNDHSFFFIVKFDKKRLVSLKMVPLLISQFQTNISHEDEHLKRMEMLCKELKTYPRRENHFLKLDL